MMDEKTTRIDNFTKQIPQTPYFFKVKHKEPRIPIIIRITCVTNMNYTLLKIYFLESV